jgi:very-short-patch-repair endonuclease
MSKKKEPDEFRCSKCIANFRGSDSFHGEFQVRRGSVLKIQLCMKCLYETIAGWDGEFNNLRAQIEREKENCIRQHKIDRNADAKRIAYDKVLDLIDNSTMYNGYNERTGYVRELSGTEIEGRRIVHSEYKINFEEQVKTGSGHIVDGLIHRGKKWIALEFDSAYYHSTEEQKERDRKKDAALAMHGYKVVRIPEKIIKNKNDRSQLMTILLDALYDVKRGNNKVEVPKLPVAPAST